MSCRCRRHIAPTPAIVGLLALGALAAASALRRRLRRPPPVDTAAAAAAGMGNVLSPSPALPCLRADSLGARHRRHSHRRPASCCTTKSRRCSWRRWGQATAPVAAPRTPRRQLMRLAMLVHRRRPLCTRMLPRTMTDVTMALKMPALEAVRSLLPCWRWAGSLLPCAGVSGGFRACVLTLRGGGCAGDYQYTSYAAAVATARAAAAAHAATRARDISNLHASGASSGAPAAAGAGAAPDAGSAPSSRQDATPGAATSSGAAAPRAAAPAASTAVAAPPGGGAFVHPSQPATTAVGASAPLSPAAIAATAAAAAAQAAASSQGDAGAAAAASALYHATYAAHAAQLAMQQAAAQARAHGIELPPALMAPLTGPGGQVFSSPYRAPVAGGELAMPAGMVYQQQPAQPHRTPTKGRKGKPPMTPGSTPRRRKSERAAPRSGGRRGSTGSQKQRTWPWREEEVVPCRQSHGGDLVWCSILCAKQRKQHGSTAGYHPQPPRHGNVRVLSSSEIHFARGRHQVRARARVCVWLYVGWCGGGRAWTCR